MGTKLWEHLRLIIKTVWLIYENCMRSFKKVWVGKSLQFKQTQKSDAKISDDDKPLTVEMIKGYINTYAQRFKLVRNSYKPRNLENALFASSYSSGEGTYNAICSNYDMRGHKGADYRKQENNMRLAR